MRQCFRFAIVGLLAVLATPAKAVTTDFFNTTQTMTVVSSSINSITIQSGAYRFTYSVDGYWSPSPGGAPTGRFFSVLWPNGVQAQAITSGPLIGKGANISIKRVDGQPFSLNSFTGKILLNTAGAGAAFEIMPLIDGEDAFNDPLQYDCTGYGNQSFSYTPALASYDSYKIHMWGDFALTALRLIDASAPVTSTISSGVAPVGAGTLGGAGTYVDGSICTLTATANAGWAFANWTENGAEVSTSTSYAFTVAGSRVLTANFTPALPPIASGGTFYQLSGQPLTLSINDLMAFDAPQIAGNVWFVSVDATTSNGLTITVDLNAMEISLPANAVADQFTYTIEDDAGTTANGTATISIITSALGQSTGLDLGSTPGAATVGFTGVPWYTYTVERCADLTFSGPSLQSWTVQASADGTLGISDDFADLGTQPERAFYRLVYP